MLNKCDLLTPEDAAARAAAFVAQLNWDGPTYRISAATGAGTRELVMDLMQRLETAAEDEAAT